LSTCEGTEYDEVFDPVVVKVFDPIRADNKEYDLTVEIEIDSVFAMYAFDNPKGYKSLFKIRENDRLEPLKDYQLTISEKVKESGYKYKVTIKQEVVLKDTSNAPIIAADLDLYLMGCENNFHNIESTTLEFNLAEAIDNEVRTEKDSLWIIFLLAFAGGFLALLTPCVFPMIPMTVSFFTKQSKTKAEGIRKAIFYAVSIIVIYVILGVLVSQIAGEDALNAMATNPWVNLVFFILFVVFAISFLGAFEITLPSSWVNKADKQADRGGMIGIFFMAFTLALVSFSCTGPIVGSVLVQSAQGGLSGPIVAMLGFSTALALPFGLFAAFPGWLNSLPSSGGWLNTVKVVLGFAELALALKFLSNADLVLQLHMLERETFLAIWIGVFLVLGIYLLGKIQFPHDSPVEKLSVGRGIFAIFTFSFVLYLLPGIWGAPLKLISGFPPPMTYSESPYGLHGEEPEIPEGWPETTVPHGHDINTVRDYEDALEYAKEVDKPVLLDFTGWACVNCRKMEEYVWSDPSVSPLMADEFIVASLYVDDRTDLPKKYEGEKNRNGELMETTGDKWMDMQITEYQEVTQPMYVVIDHKGNNISGKANYQTHSNAGDFKAWLEFALEQFESSKNATIIKPEFEVIQ
jgi:thiol:disulfide interchange protein DsbD